MATNLINCSVDNNGVFFTSQQDAGDGPLIMVGGPFSTISTLEKQPWTDSTGFIPADLPVGHYKATISADAGYGVTVNNFTINGFQSTSSSYFLYQDPHYSALGENINCLMWLNGATNSLGETIVLDSNVERVLLRNTTGPQNYQQSLSGSGVEPVSPNNKVEVSVILYDTFIMPEESLTINIDIDGAAVPLELDGDYTIDEETGLIIPEYQTNSPFEVRFIPIRVGGSDNFSMWLRRMGTSFTDSQFDEFSFFNYVESPYDEQQLNILDNNACMSGVYSSDNNANFGYTNTEYFSTTGFGEGTSNILSVNFSNDLQDNYIVKPFVITFFNGETNIGIQTYLDEAGAGGFENCVAHARNNIEDYGSQGLYNNSIGTSFLNGQQLRWQFTVGRNIGSSPNSSQAAYGNGWPKIPQQNDNNQYSNYLNSWGFNTWDYIDNNDNSQILFNILDTTIRWPMVSTNGNYFYYQNFVTGDNNPFGSPIITLNQDNEFQSPYSGGSQALGNYWPSYSNAVGAYTQLDLKMPFNPNFIFSPPSQATGYWTLNSPVYVYIFYQANPVFYTASTVTNPYGPDEDD
jgi:hypothetical protein